MLEIACPICGKAHQSVPYQCDCGYNESKLQNYRDENNQLFAVYKFSKQIFNKKLDWQQSRYDYDVHHNGHVSIQEIFEDKSIAYVDLPIEGKLVKATAGVLAFKRHVKSLIINAEVLDHEMLDESGVRMLFIGDRVREITSFINTSLKYIEVDKNNPYFTSQNNILFDKKMTRLITYCNMKPDTEYTIPETVKEVDAWAFINFRERLDALRVIHCSQKVKFEDARCTPSPYDTIKIVRH